MAERAFRERLRAGERLVGTFVKTPALQTVEILALAGLDFIVIDQEHSPFDRLTTDASLFAAKALSLPALVRVPGGAPEQLLSVLDCGATGVLVPHVASPEKAREVADACRYAGSRGYSGSVRSAGYGGGTLRETIAAADRDTVVIAQIEDAEALDHLDTIAACEGIDALFIGRGDLAVSLGADSAGAASVRAAAERIAGAATAGGKACAAFVSNAEEAHWLCQLGVTAFVHSSDQTFLRKAADADARAIRNLSARAAS